MTISDGSYRLSKMCQRTYWKPRRSCRYFAKKRTAYSWICSKNLGMVDLVRMTKMMAQWNAYMTTFDAVAD